MPVVRISLLKGRTSEQKKNLISGVTDAISKALNKDKEYVWVILDEVDKEHFGVGGVSCDQREVQGVD
ncbi:MAG: 2-hydroxymuconate tautomerase [Candidatus Woesearchaeota archaeon]|jgi:4-oxalocrotonate tautomerase|nr:2-hydroxymuconate tautomerase [Candidatus Woesearchaeota archaeon]MDP7457587.1 2-hydroxymuconate tautomerase [Candidatus Woesearchaeota archaeon]